ncbi:MAG: DUF302 domain-containing protein [Methylococcales bacterium]|nr:DUF302 domain-containing protein [Methylococcales bacterium]
MLIRSFIFASLLVIVSCASQPNSEIIHYYQAETQKPYDDVLAELEIAIAEHNFRITGHSRVGKVIRDRGTKDFPNYDTLQFCNLTHAKTLLLMSPHAVSYMPCNIVTYEFDGRIIIKTHLLPTDTNNLKLNQFSETMNKTLKQIVDFAAED